MTAKRFIVDTNVITGNKGIWDRLTDEEYYDNWDELEECLNALHEENTHIKTTIQTMIKNERTAIGQSVLQQLWEAIQ